MKKKDQIAILEASQKARPNPETAQALASLKKHKYGARRTTACRACGAEQECECWDPVNFDSRKEARYYQELLLLKRAGHVTEIELQPEYVLQDRFTKGGKTYRPIKYRADFKITYADGTTEIVDCKGAATREFKIKQKLFEKRYPGLNIKQV